MFALQLTLTEKLKTKLRAASGKNHELETKIFELETEKVKMLKHKSHYFFVKVFFCFCFFWESRHLVALNYRMNG